MIHNYLMFIILHTNPCFLPLTPFLPFFFKILPTKLSHIVDLDFPYILNLEIYPLHLPVTVILWRYPYQQNNLLTFQYCCSPVLNLFCSLYLKYFISVNCILHFCCTNHCIFCNCNSVACLLIMFSHNVFNRHFIVSYYILLFCSWTLQFFFWQILFSLCEIDLL